MLPCRSIITAVALLHSTVDYVLPVEYTTASGARFYFDTTRRIKFDPPDKRGGGVSDTAPSLKRHSSFYIEPNTGDNR